LAAETVFRLIRCAWVKIPNAFAFFPFSSASLPGLHFTFFEFLSLFSIKKKQPSPSMAAFYFL